MRTIASAYVPSMSTDQSRQAKARRGLQSALVYFGLAEEAGPDGQSQSLLQKPSRYGNGVSQRLDQEIDALKARIAELEARGR